MKWTPDCSRGKFFTLTQVSWLAFRCCCRQLRYLRHLFLLLPRDSICLSQEFDLLKANAKKIIYMFKNLCLTIQNPHPSGFQTPTLFWWKYGCLSDANHLNTGPLFIRKYGHTSWVSEKWSNTLNTGHLNTNKIGIKIPDHWRIPNYFGIQILTVRTFF